MKFNLSKTAISLLLISCMFIPTACNNDNDSKTEATTTDTVATSETFEDIFPEDELYEPIWDGAFSYDDYDSSGVEAVDNFKYYVHEKGSSSSYTRIVISRFGNRLICTCERFFCGDGYMEAFPLSQKQGDAFLELVKDYEETERPEFEYEEGGYEYEFKLKFGDSVKYINGIDMSGLDLDLTSEDDIDYEDYEDITDLFDLSKDTEYKFHTCDDTYFSGLTQAPCVAVYVQLKDYLGYDDRDIESVSIIEMYDDYVELKVSLDSGESFAITTTYGGCILTVEEN